ncbi:hypothetical protein C1893_14605 [Pseudomonas sp. MPR-ANC1]|nr:hypothetical protein C1893_14605 [Pseudomonas sp. MPR-ANC1]
MFGVGEEVTRFPTSHGTCGSGLARDGGVSGNDNVGCAGLIAGKPAPTGFYGVTEAVQAWAVRRSSRGQRAKRAR